MPVLFGIIGIAIGVAFGISLRSFVAALVVMAGFVIVLGAPLCLLASWNARRALGDLVACLEKMFKARRTR